MDLEHRALIELFAALDEAILQKKTRGTLLEICDKIIHDMRGHFASEEKLLETHAYPGFPKQRNDHAALLEQLNVIRSKLASGQLEFTAETAEMFYKPFLNHITGADLAYGEFISSGGL